MNIKLTLSIIIIVLVILVGGWFLYGNYAPNVDQVDQESAQDSTGDSTATIESDLNQVPDDSAINGDMDALDASVQAF